MVYLKCGDTWTGETLTLHGSGTATNPITITSYGSGNKPIISPGLGVVNNAIIQDDCHGYKYINLEICNTYTGIKSRSNETFGHDYLWVENCYFHDMTTPTESPRGVGITIQGTDINSTGNTIYSNITVKGCSFYRTDTGFGIGVDNARPGYKNAYTNLNILNSTFTQNYRTGAIIVTSTTGGSIDGCVIDQTGYQKGMSWGGAGVQFTNAKDYQLINSEIKNTLRDNNSPDGETVDFEDANENVTIDNCNMHDNVGPAVMFFGDNSYWPTVGNVNCTVKNSILKNNNSTQFQGNISWLLNSGKSGWKVTNDANTFCGYKFQ